MKNPDKIKNIYIFAGGTIDEKIININFEHNDLLVAVDSGAEALYAKGIVPDYFLGDFDSLENVLLEKIEQNYPERIVRFPSMKNETDSELALQFALKFESERIILYGATGTRIDHVWANINILLQAEKQGVSAVICDTHNRVQLLLPKRELQIVNDEYQFLSLLAFSEEVKGLRATGLKYPLEDLSLKQGSTRGLSNELIGKQASISIVEGILLVIESKD